MAGEGNPNNFLEREIRMVLVGKTGVGKSETGNTLCGAGKLAQIFKAMTKAMSVTTKCQQHSFKRFGYDLQLVDVPGFCDTSKSEEDIQKEIVKCVGMSSPGIHAILVIVRIGRFTKEDKDALERFLCCFGQEAKKFVIVVFTGKDDLEADNDTIENYIGDCPDSLKQFLFDASLRFIAVNNKGSDEEKEKFSKALIEKIKNMVTANGGQCYTDKMYERCEADLREAEKREKLEGKRQEEFEEKCKLERERQKEFEEKCKREAAALEGQLQRQRLQFQEIEKQLQKERKLREKDQEDHMNKRLKALELSVRTEEENKRLEEEKKRQEQQREAEENMRRELERMKESQRKQTEHYDRKIEEMRLEEARKQIREKVQNDDTSYLGSFLQWCGSWFQ